jgi:outer membrane immunogenic protein
MKKLIAAALLCSTSAFAADLRVPPPYKAPAIEAYSWSGLWLGAFIGGGINSTKSSANIEGLGVDLGTMPKGVLGGLELGYDFQFAQNWVFGLFIEGSLANLSDTGVVTSGPITMLSNGMATNYMLAAGGRLGFLVSPNSLIYGKAGIAGVGDKPNWQVATLQQAVSDTRAGWVAGGGIEHRLSFAPNWSVKLEYDHWQAGDRTFSFTNPDGSVFATASNKISIDAVRAGLTLRF